MLFIGKISFARVAAGAVAAAIAIMIFSLDKNI